MRLERESDEDPAISASVGEFVIDIREAVGAVGFGVAVVFSLNPNLALGRFRARREGEEVARFEGAELDEAKPAGGEVGFVHFLVSLFEVVVRWFGKLTAYIIPHITRYVKYKLHKKPKKI